MEQNTILQKQKRLTKIADSDEAFLVWKNSFHQFSDSFAHYADSQPEPIRNILWGYAESGRMMYQRMVNLACENMDFTEK